MVINGIHFPEDKIAALCRDASIVRLYLFGSVLTDRFQPDSDVDVLVETDPDNPPGLLRLGGFQAELSELLGRDVHITTLGGVPRDLRAPLLSQAKLIDAA